MSPIVKKRVAMRIGGFGNRIWKKLKRKFNIAPKISNYLIDKKLSFGKIKTIF